MTEHLTLSLKPLSPDPGPLGIFIPQLPVLRPNKDGPGSWKPITRKLGFTSEQVDPGSFRELAMPILYYI